MALSVFPAGGGREKKIPEIIRKETSASFFYGEKSGDGASISGRGYTKTNNEPVILAGIVFAGNTAASFIVIGRTKTSVDFSSSVSFNGVEEVTFNGKQFYCRFLANALGAFSAISIVSNAKASSVSTSVWRDILKVDGDVKIDLDQQTTKDLFTLADLILPD